MKEKRRKLEKTKKAKKTKIVRRMIRKEEQKVQNRGRL